MTLYFEVMKTMMISEFKAKAIAVLKQVNGSKEPLEITLRGQPIAQILPPASVAGPEVRFDTGAGLLEDSMSLADWENNSLEQDWEEQL
jgi:prevent-host-death family protein